MNAVRSLLRRSVLPLLLLGTTTLAACAVSTQQEIELGRQYAAEVNRELPVVRDAAINRAINALGNRIAARGDRNLDYEFYVVNTDAINAFALPGGFIYVNRGLIERTDDLSELAGVLAHEIGHVEERHSAEQIERMQTTNLGLNLGYILLGRTPGNVEAAGINIAGSAIFASFTRDAENEADEAAVELLVESGIDPNGLVTFFNELLEERARRPSAIEQWFSTHPLTEDRIEHTRAVIRRVPAGRLRGLATDSEEYRRLKAMVRRLPAAR